MVDSVGGGGGGGGSGEGEGGRDSAPLLKSARVTAGVLLCYGAALDGDPREDR